MTECLLSRESLIDRLVDSLKRHDFVLAIWEGGSAAFDRLDVYSDIDLYVLVEAGASPRTFREVESTLESMSPIGSKYVPESLPWPGVMQAFYKLERAPDLLLIDLAVIEEGSPESFLEIEVHGRALIYFSRNELELPHVDRKKLASRIEGRLDTILLRFDMFSPFLRKEVLRGNLIDAIETYRWIYLGSLVELLRIRYCSPRHGFGVWHLEHELPDRAMSELENLFLVHAFDDLLEKSEAAEAWIRELHSEINRLGVAPLVAEAIDRSRPRREPKQGHSSASPDGSA